jgi:hypothetical protein
VSVKLVGGWVDRAELNRIWVTADTASPVTPVADKHCNITEPDRLHRAAHTQSVGRQGNADVTRLPLNDALSQT